MRLVRLNRAANQTLFWLRGGLRCRSLAVSLVKGKRGLEIGGPSRVFQNWCSQLPLYKEVGSLDNCDYAQQNIWASHSESYIFNRDNPAGRTIICDASDLSILGDNSYDFVLSSHSLEHIANPIRALKEWQRLIRPGGTLILVLPNYVTTFDHRRKPTSVDHMIADFNRGVGEDDLTHLPEIMELYDDTMNPSDHGLSTEARYQLSLDNFKNRMFHHHVFDQINSRELLSQVGMEVIAVETAEPVHIFLIACISK